MLKVASNSRLPATLQIQLEINFDLQPALSLPEQNQDYEQHRKNHLVGFSFLPHENRPRP